MTKVLCFTVDLDRDVNEPVYGSVAAGSKDFGDGNAPRFSSSGRGAELLVELLDEGVNVEAYSPDYYYTKLSDLKMEMLAEATQDARMRAETITANAGSSLGALKIANTGVFQITAPNSSDEDYTWGGAFNTSSKNKRASVNMRLTYYVK